MKDDEYLHVQHTVMACARIVAGLDLMGFLARIDQCETLAPIIDPTLYRKGMLPLENIKRHAEGARAFQREVLACAEESERT